MRQAHNAEEANDKRRAHGGCAVDVREMKTIKDQFVLQLDDKITKKKKTKIFYYQKKTIKINYRLNKVSLL